MKSYVVILVIMEGTRTREHARAEDLEVVILVIMDGERTVKIIIV